MAYFPANPNLFNPAGIIAQQTNVLPGAWIVTQAFSDWIDANQPISFVISMGSIWIDIPDWNPSVAMDYVANWANAPVPE